MQAVRAFSNDFVWGVATSAYQVEGAHDVDGRALSIWDTFCRRPGAIDNGDTGDVACDHYHRWQEDLDLIAELGLDAYRFSIAWPRVLPNGAGPVNQKGIDFYDALVDGLLERGIKPFVTLYHWDLPQALQDLGGWTRRETASTFADYTSVVVDALSDRVQYWTTLNEPLCSAWLGHLDGVMAPGLKDVTAAVRASVHLHLAHGLAVQAIRSAAKLPPKVGIVNNLSPITPASDSPDDVAAAQRADGHTNRWWLDPIHGRGYPADMVRAYGVELPIQDGDLELIAAPLDYLGVNYYFRQVVRHRADAGALQFEEVAVDDAVQTAMGWEVRPKGLEDILVRVTADYSPRAIYITENGSAWHDEPDSHEYVDDAERIAYFDSHISACAAAARRGAPVAGYFAWSLLDNFEWAYGYDKRFGIVRVDYETQRRTVKASGRWFAQLVRNGKLGNPTSAE